MTAPAPLAPDPARAETIALLTQIEARLPAVLALVPSVLLVTTAAAGQSSSPANTKDWLCTKTVPSQSTASASFLL